MYRQFDWRFSLLENVNALKYLPSSRQKDSAFAVLAAEDIDVRAVPFGSCSQTEKDVSVRQ